MLEVHHMRVVVVLLWVAVFLFVSELRGPVNAYLDPGSGSMAIQLIFGGIVAALTAARLYWARVAAFFRGRSAAGDVPRDERPIVP
jgi:hypothetical protein